MDGVQEGEAGGRTLEVGQGSMAPLPDVADLPPPEIADPSPPEIADSSTAEVVDPLNF